MGCESRPRLALACVANETSISECKSKLKLAQRQHGAASGGDSHIPGGTARRELRRQKLVLVSKKNLRKLALGEVRTMETTVGSETCQPSIGFPVGQSHWHGRGRKARTNDLFARQETAKAQSQGGGINSYENRTREQQRDRRRPRTVAVATFRPSDLLSTETLPATSHQITPRPHPHPHTPSYACASWRRWTTERPRHGRKPGEYGGWPGGG